ncbi:MAG: 2-oxoacid:ferredoxin oxidoreductase subunit beta [Nitrososphaerales archaeon]
MSKKLTISDLDWHDPTWCPGCGDYALLAALKQAVVRLELDPKDIVIVSGIGCSSKLTDYFKSYGFHTLHGRPIPVATAIKLANPKLTVIVTTGDGDGYAIGMGHFIHAARRNIDITMLVMNNQVYGLTKGQYSPTADMDFVSGTTPQGSKDQPIDGVALALASGASFVARSFSGNIKHTSHLIEEAIKHKGFALVDDLSPCVTFNKVNTYAWFKQNIENVDEDKSYNPGNVVSAFNRAKESEKIPIGLLYREEKPTYEDMVLDRRRGPLVFEDLSLKQSEFDKLIAKFKY